MALTILSDQLLLPVPGEALIYAVETQTEIRLPGQVMRQDTNALLRYTVQDTLLTAPHLVELVTVELRATSAASPFAELLLDIARANSPLLIEVDPQGQFQRVRNKPALAAQWQELLPWLRTKHQQTPGAMQLLGQLATQYADDNDRLEQALAHKGNCGVLLPALFGLRSTGDTRTSHRTLHQFFPGGDLPLEVEWAVGAADALDLTADVQATGRLDTARFDHSAFQQHLTTMTGPMARPPALQVAWAEDYTVSRAGQGLLMGQQTLRIGIPGLYEQHTRHTLRQPSTPAPGRLA